MIFGLGSRRDQEGDVRREGRLPPGQSLTQKFPVLHYGPVPRFDPAKWDLKVAGRDQEEKRWTWNEFQQLPRTQIAHGYPLCHTLEQVRYNLGGRFAAHADGRRRSALKPGAHFLMQHCEYGFTVNVPLEVALLAENFLMATHYDGQPLTPDHGYPLRGVVGSVVRGQNDLAVPYFWKGGKWLRGLEFMAKDRLGFWEQAGYHNEADVWKEQRHAGW